MEQASAQRLNSRQRSTPTETGEAFSVPSLFRLRSSAGEVYGCRGPQQDLRHAILSGMFRPGMAANAIALLASTNPEPPMFLANRLPLRVEQDEADSPVSRRLHKKRAVTLNRSRAHVNRVPRCI